MDCGHESTVWLCLDCRPLAGLKAREPVRVGLVLVGLGIYLHLSVFPDIGSHYLQTQFVSLRVRACMPACLPVCLRACLPACLPAWLPGYLPACLPGGLAAQATQTNVN